MNLQADGNGGSNPLGGDQFLSKSPIRQFCLVLGPGIETKSPPPHDKIFTLVQVDWFVQLYISEVHWAIPENIHTPAMDDTELGT